MDSRNFDTLTRRFVTRRAGAGLALAGLLGMAVPEADAKKRKKKCRPKCGACETCKKGKCKPIPGQKPCGAECIASDACCTGGQARCLHNFTCVSGACVNCVGANCGSPSQCCTGLCIGGACSCAEVNEACTTNAQCCDGTCKAGKCCIPSGGLCNALNQCCSGQCSVGSCP